MRNYLLLRNLFSRYPHSFATLKTTMTTVIHPRDAKSHLISGAAVWLI